MTGGLGYSDIKECFRRLQAVRPEPEGELDHVNAYTLVVAVALSAQATDKGVNRATKDLFKIADTPEKMISLGEEKLIEHIRTIGLFRNKAKNVMKLSQILIDEHDGVVPSSREALSALPGVGRKTANVVLNMWWRHPAQAVDTHVFRVSNRTGIAPGKDVVAVEKALEDRIPAEYALHAHHWLILHGRYTCMARKPDCPHCPISDICLFDEKVGLSEPDDTAAPPVLPPVAGEGEAAAVSPPRSRGTKPAAKGRKTMREHPAKDRGKALDRHQRKTLAKGSTEE